jgi:hypothetical protein
MASPTTPAAPPAVAFPQFFMTIDRVYKIPRGYNWNVSYQTELFDETVSKSATSVPPATTCRASAT